MTVILTCELKMSNVLILTRIPLGDFIAGTVLIINHNKKNVIDILFPENNDRSVKIEQLLRKIPYVNSIFQFNEFNKSTIINYDLIYVPIELKKKWDILSKEWNKELNKGKTWDTIKENKIVQYYKLFNSKFYVLEDVAKQLNINNYDIKISIDWYNEFYKNYNFSKKSLLLNTKSTSMNRNYYHKMELKQELTNCGFNVIEINNDKNICENLHVLNQVKYIITVDTGLLWLAKSLGKKPFAIKSELNPDLNIFTYEKILGVKFLNGRTPKEMVEDFLYSIQII